MTSISLALARKLAERGRVDPKELDRALESIKCGNRNRREQIAAATAAVPRVRLIFPVEFTIPLELMTENRLRAMQPIHRGRVLKAQREVVRNAWLLHFRHMIPELPVIVTQTRVGRRMDPHDSLPAAFKHVTDEITELIGLRNDDTSLVTWVFGPQIAGTPAIIIRVESREDGGHIAARKDGR